jgi:hypothetical protein
VIQLHAEQLVDQGGLGRDNLGTRRSRIETPAKLPTAVVAGTPQELEDALSVVSSDAGNRAGESPPVEDLRRCVKRVHRCAQGPQAAVGGITLNREPLAAPGSMVLQPASNAVSPQAHTELRGAGGAVMYNRKRRRDRTSIPIARRRVARVPVQS